MTEIVDSIRITAWSKTYKVKQCGHCIMAWAGMSFSGRGSLNFTDYVIHDGSCTIYSEIYRKRDKKSVRILAYLQNGCSAIKNA